jgi:hypothetical protein
VRANSSVFSHRPILVTFPFIFLAIELSSFSKTRPSSSLTPTDTAQFVESMSHVYAIVESLCYEIFGLTIALFLE